MHPSSCTTSSNSNTCNNKVSENRKRGHGATGKAHYSSRKRHRTDRRGQSVVEKPSIVCSVCSTIENPKYKCPKCRLRYCSIQCCRQHKEQCVQHVQPMQQPEIASKSRYLLETQEHGVNQQRMLKPSNKRTETLDDDELDPDWKIPSEDLQRLETSEWLHKELSDTGLRQLITKIVSASRNLNGNLQTEQELVLAQCKADHPMLKRFLDKLLVLAGVLERQLEDKESDLKTWLESSNNRDIHPLVLRSVDRPKRPLSEDVQSTDTTTTSSSDDDSESDDNSVDEDSDENNSSDSESDESLVLQVTERTCANGPLVF